MCLMEARKTTKPCKYCGVAIPAFGGYGDSHVGWISWDKDGNAFKTVSCYPEIVYEPFISKYYDIIQEDKKNLQIDDNVWLENQIAILDAWAEQTLLWAEQHNGT